MMHDEFLDVLILDFDSESMVPTRRAPNVSEELARWGEEVFGEDVLVEEQNVGGENNVREVAEFDAGQEMEAVARAWRT